MRCPVCGSPCDCYQELHEIEGLRILVVRYLGKDRSESLKDDLATMIDMEIGEVELGDEDGK